MMHEQFDDRLRIGLATLAREAVPDDTTFVDDLPRVEPISAAHDRRIGTRAMAVVIALVVALAAGAIALATHRDGHVPRIETPQPTWLRLPRFPLVARSEQSAVFTGHQVLVWGGRSDPQGNVASAKSPTDSLADGAAYDVGKNTWSVLPPAPIDARFDAVSAWTGSEMLVVGGRRSGAGPTGGDGFLNDGAAYDPVHHRWRPLPDAPGCPGVGTWTGHTLVVAGACADRTSRKLVTAEYDPERNRWTTLPNFADTVQLVSAGGRVFAWNYVTDRAAVLDRASRSWTALPALPAPNRGYHQSALPVAYGGHLAVASNLQRPSDDPPRDRAAVDILDLDTRSWRHYESTAVRSATQGMLITSDEHVVLWGDELSSTWFTAAPAGGEPAWSSTGAGPVRIGSGGESLLPIGPRRFFMWGGQLAGTQQEPTMRPTREGAILELP